MALLLLSTLLAVPALAVNITFASEPHCGGIGLYGIQDVDQAIPCYNITQYDTARSVLLGDLTGYTVKFYSDASCHTEVVKAFTDSCLDLSGHAVRGFTLQKDGFPTSIDTASNGTSSNTTDLVPYGIKLSDYKTLATAPGAIDLSETHGWIQFAFKASGVATSFGVAAAGCYFHDVHAVALFACIGGGISTVASFIGHTYANIGAALLVGYHYFWNTLTFRDSRRDSTIDHAIYDFLADVHNDTQWVHTGWMDKDMGHGSQRSPIYRLNTTHEVMSQYEFSAFFNHESARMQHHVQFTPEALNASQVLTKRSTPPYGYNTLSAKSAGTGMVFDWCPRGSKRTGTDWNDSLTTIYNRLYGYVMCLNPQATYSKATSLIMDYYDNGGHIMGTAAIAVYTSGNAANFGGFTSCDNTPTSPNQNCISQE